MTRLWQPRETRLLSEWVSKNYSDSRVFYRVRLGSYPSWAQKAINKGAPAAIYKVYQRWADAIVITDKELILIEAKIKADPGVISQINLYEQLLPKTESFQQFRDLPIRKLILMAQSDPEVELLAQRENITVKIFSPPWVTDYLKEIRKYRER